jgi:hypothetical protein
MSTPALLDLMMKYTNRSISMREKASLRLTEQFDMLQREFTPLSDDLNTLLAAVRESALASDLNHTALHMRKLLFSWAHIVEHMSPARVSRTSHKLATKEDAATFTKLLLGEISKMSQSCDGIIHNLSRKCLEQPAGSNSVKVKEIVDPDDPELPQMSDAECWELVMDMFDILEKHRQYIVARIVTTPMQNNPRGFPRQSAKANCQSYVRFDGTDMLKKFEQLAAPLREPFQQVLESMENSGQVRIVLWKMRNFVDAFAEHICRRAGHLLTC